VTWGGGAGSGRACALGRSGGGGGARTLVPGRLLVGLMLGVLRCFRPMFQLSVFVCFDLV